MKKVSKKDWEIISSTVAHFIEDGHNVWITAAEADIADKHMPGVFEILQCGGGLKANKVGKIPMHMELLYWKEMAETYRKNYWDMHVAMETILEKY